MRQKNAGFMDDVLKTRGIKYLNVDAWMLFAPPIKISGYAPGRFIDSAQLVMRVFVAQFESCSSIKDNNIYFELGS